MLPQVGVGSAKPAEGILFDGQVFDAYTFINDRIREAKTRIILIDNYPDDSVLKMLDKRKKWFAFSIMNTWTTDELLSKI